MSGGAPRDLPHAVARAVRAAGEAAGLEVHLPPGRLDAGRVGRGPHDSPDVADLDVVRGELHDVVLLPGRAVVKVARGRAAQHLARRAALLARLQTVALPVAVPRPLGPVVREHDGAPAAVALSWVGGDGSPTPHGAGARTRLVGELAGLLQALRAAPLDDLAGLLDEPHAYAGRSRWRELLLEGVVPRLPRRWQEAARERVQAAHELPAAVPSLVHGDLAGDNLRWRGDRLVAVLDWDLAAAWDPAVDLACLSWFGWDLVGRLADDHEVVRARTWAGTFPLEQVAALLDDGAPEAAVDAAVGRCVGWLERDASGPLPGS